MQEGQHGGPAGNGLARAQGAVEDAVYQAQRSLEFGQQAQISNGVGDAANQRRAALAGVYVQIKSVLLVGREQPVEVVGEAEFGLFASPSHDGRTPICCKIRSSSMRPRLILDFTVPSGT